MAERNLTNAALRVLDAYDDPGVPQRIETLGSCGGFSGAEFWKIAVANGSYCLRRWPREHPDQKRLEYIHSVLQHAAGNGLSFVSVPIRTRSGQTFVQLDRRFWELSRWMPGAADYHHEPNLNRLTAALTALARHS